MKAPKATRNWYLLKAAEHFDAYLTWGLPSLNKELHEQYCYWYLLMSIIDEDDLPCD